MSVSENSARHRFEYEVEGKTAFLDYRRSPGIVALMHAEVPTELEGRGVGSHLVRGALDLIRPTGDKVVPACSFVAAFIRRNPEYQDLVAS